MAMRRWRFECGTHTHGGRNGYLDKPLGTQLPRSPSPLSAVTDIS